MSERLIVVAPTHEISPGKIFQRLPLHITFTPRFIVDSNMISAVKHSIKVATEIHKSIEYNGGDKAYYGPDFNIPVRLFSWDAASSASVRSLHSAVFNAVDEYDPAIDKTYSLGNYSPHISDSEGEFVAHG